MFKGSFECATLHVMVGLGLVGAMGIASSGCSVHDDHDDEVVVPEGSLVLTWELDEGSDSSICTKENAAQIQVSVTASDGTDAGTYTQACSDLSTSITLDPGSYSATALMLDAQGNKRTTAINVNPFTIHGGVEQDITIDFPADSFE